MFAILTFFLLLASAVSTHAASVLLQWDAGTGPGLPTAGYQMQRCLVPTGQTSCPPTVDLPSGAVLAPVTTFTDTTVTPGSVYCWTVWGVGTDGSRVQVLPGADGKRFVCKTVTQTLPPPGPTTLQPLEVGLRVTWLPPTFTGTDATPSMLTRYDIWRRADPGSNWLTVGTVGPTITTWDDVAATTALAPGFCYEIRAVYNPIASVGNGMVCAKAGPPPAPTGPPAPINLRLAP